MDQQTHDAGRMLAALCNSDAYDHPAAKIVHLHTHISDIFLAGEYAYKIKKPVDFGFLDFTTPEKRLRACRDEVRLNSRLAPQIYLGVVPIYLSGGGYHVGDMTQTIYSRVVDYAVWMTRMPEDGMLDRVAAAGGLRREHMLDIAHQMAQFHATAERNADIDRFGGMQGIRNHVRQNFGQTKRFIDYSITRTQFEYLKDYMEGYMRTHDLLFSARVSASRVVDGHGDLHLRNMCLYREKVIIFDCIEFNPQLRACDVIGDIAFLTMDLDARHLPGLGNNFLNAYLEETGDYAGLGMLDFYQSYRAYVRGKVASFLLLDASNETERANAMREAKGYFDLAQSYLSGGTGGLLITCGPSASGKTTVASQIAETMRGIAVRSDAVRKQLAGVALQQTNSTPYQRGIYSVEMTKRTYRSLLDKARAIIDSGRWAILDATFAQRAQRLEAEALAHSLGTGFGIIYCTASRSELANRLDKRSRLHLDISDATQEVLDEQLRRFEAPQPDEGPIFQWTGTEDVGPWLVGLSRAS